jgi:hypothetical protein
MLQEGLRDVLFNLVLHARSVRFLRVFAIPHCSGIKFLYLVCSLVAVAL